MATRKKTTKKAPKKSVKKPAAKKPAKKKAATKKTPKAPKRGKKLYEGKSKTLYASSDPKALICYFKDDATAFNAAKKGTILDKGMFNNEISAAIMERLEKLGIATHYIRRLSDREQLVRKVDIIPVEVIVRNIVAGSAAKRLGIDEGFVLKRPVVEFCYKSDPQGDPFIGRDMAVGMGWATQKEMLYLHESALKINQILIKMFKKLGITLVDYKLEYGRVGNKIYLADEITPDGCRLWDAKTGEKLDKDRFRRDLGNVEQAYARVHKAVLGAK
ncbi:MAG: phosphoribosylaminoimidazolesuccinocarboxamide synthase [Chrysiogenetes bacterium]|nr:phosphoribosylaminoimidazolesuccinocarboxamide synthase [Chrysiogenetes bacterium]